MGVEYRLWTEGSEGPGGREALNGEAIDASHGPQLRSRVRWNGYDSGPRSAEAFGTVEAWTPERGWSEVLRETGDELVLSGEAVNREDDWRDDAVADLDRLLGRGRLFFAARKPPPFTSPEDPLRG